MTCCVFFGGACAFFWGKCWRVSCVVDVDVALRPIVNGKKKTPQIPILISQFSIIITTDPHGGLIDYEALQPRLEILLKSHQEDARLTASLEKRVDALMERHATHVRIRFCFCFSVL